MKKYTELRLSLIVLSIFSGALLILTSDQMIPSLSSTAYNNNAIFFRLMLLSLSWFFLINAIVFKKYATEFVLAIGSGIILAFDMYNFPLIHNIVTGGILLLACFTVIVNVHKTFNYSIGIICSILAVGTFVLGFFTEDISFAWAEVMSVFFISLAKGIEVIDND